MVAMKIKKKQNITKNEIILFLLKKIIFMRSKG